MGFIKTSEVHYRSTSKIIDGEQKYYIIEIPPQHGKSTVITETFPAYYLMRHPDSLVMVVSYSKELFQKFGRKNREKFRLFSEQLFGLQISSETSSVSEWGVEGHLGSLYSTSILGGATGRGARLLIIDDPIKIGQKPNLKQFAIKYIMSGKTLSILV